MLAADEVREDLQITLRCATDGQAFFFVSGNRFGASPVRQINVGAAPLSALAASICGAARLELRHEKSRVQLFEGTESKLELIVQRDDARIARLEPSVLVDDGAFEACGRGPAFIELVAQRGDLPAQSVELVVAAWSR